jgi:hypothetical protein
MNGRGILSGFHSLAIHSSADSGFNDGREGIYPVEPERRGGVFLKLLETKTFHAVTINPTSAVGTPKLFGVDLCPDTMPQASSGRGTTFTAGFARRRGKESVRNPRWRIFLCAVRTNGIKTRRVETLALTPALSPGRG